MKKIAFKQINPIYAYSDSAYLGQFRTINPKNPNSRKIYIKELKTNHCFNIIIEEYGYYMTLIWLRLKHRNAELKKSEFFHYQQIITIWLEQGGFF